MNHASSGNNPGKTRVQCGTYRAPPLRAEVLAAHEALYATHELFAYAVCRTQDGQAWEVNVRTGNIDIVLGARHSDHEAAAAAGAGFSTLRGVIKVFTSYKDASHR